jgi:uncharacterized membrane protein
VIEPALIFALLSVLVALPGIPLWIAMIGPNRYYGVRNALTLGDEAIWYAVNRTAGRDLVVMGGGSLALSALLPELGLDGAAYMAVMAVAMAAGGVLVALIALARARHLRL